MRPRTILVKKRRQKNFPSPASRLQAFNGSEEAREESEVCRHSLKVNAARVLAWSANMRHGVARCHEIKNNNGAGSSDHRDGRGAMPFISSLPHHMHIAL